MLAYFFTQRDVHSTTVKQSIKPRAELGAQARDALGPAVQPPLKCLHYIDDKNIFRAFERTFKVV